MRIAIGMGTCGNYLCQFLEAQGFVLRCPSLPYTFPRDDQLEIELVRIPVDEAAFLFSAGLIEVLINAYVSEKHMSMSLENPKTIPNIPGETDKLMAVQFWHHGQLRTGVNQYGVWVSDGLHPEHKQFLVRWILDNLPRQLNVPV